MHIEFLHDIKDPDTGEPLYHKGQRVHRMTAVCAPYLDRKVAVEIKPARRGTRDWFTERMEQAAMPRQVHANDTSVAAPVLPVGFSIVKRVNGTREQWFIQEVKRSGEAFIYENIPAGCPASVVKQWQELNGGDVDPAVAAEAKRVAQCERDRAAEVNKELETKNYHRIFGGK